MPSTPATTSAPAGAPKPALSPRFPLIDSVRAIAALSIVVYHTADSSLPRSVLNWTLRLDIGVTIFFVLSAFLLYRPFVRARLRDEPSPRTGPYAWRRFLRIVPAYWVALTALGLLLANRSVFGPDGWSFYAFGQVYSPYRVLGGLPVAWSLCVEVVLYAFLPLWAWYMRRLPGRSTPAARLRTEIVALIGLAAAGITIKVMGAHEPVAVLGFTLDSTFANYLDAFAVGMGLAVASAWYEDRPAPRVLQGLERFPGAAWAGAAVLLWVVTTQLGLPKTNWARPEATALFLKRELYIVIALLLILPAVFGRERQGMVRRVLDWRWLRWVGVVSYGVYLWHTIVLRFIWTNGIAEDLGTALRVSKPVASFIIVIPVTLLVSYLSFRFIERPAIQLGRLRPRASLVTAPAHGRWARIAGAVCAVIIAAIALLGTGYFTVDVLLGAVAALALALSVAGTQSILARLPASRTSLTGATGAIALLLLLVPLIVPPNASAQTKPLPKGLEDVKGLPPRSYAVATYDGKFLTLYVNGEVLARKEATGAVDAGKAVTELGSYLSGSVWSGGLDDVALYDAALPAQTIRAHYDLGTGNGSQYAESIKQTPGVLSYWRLSDPGNDAVDEIGTASGRYRAKGVVRDQPSLITGDPNQSVALDGLNGSIRIANVTPVPRAFTLEAWVTTGAQVSNRTIMARPGSWFLKTDLLGRWNAGFWSGGKITAVFSKNAIPRVGAPTRGLAPKSALRDDGDTTPGKAVLIVIVLVVIGGAVLAGIRRRNGPSDDDGDGPGGHDDGPGRDPDPQPEPDPRADDGEPEFDDEREPVGA